MLVTGGGAISSVRVRYFWGPEFIVLISGPPRVDPGGLEVLVSGAPRAGLKGLLELVSGPPKNINLSEHVRTRCHANHSIYLQFNK